MIRDLVRLQDDLAAYRSGFLTDKTLFERLVEAVTAVSADLTDLEQEVAIDGASFELASEALPEDEIKVGGTD